MKNSKIGWCKLVLIFIFVLLSMGFIINFLAEAKYPEVLTGDNYKPRLFFGAKFEPVSTVLHGAGQSENFEFPGYVEQLGYQHHPILYMEYTKAKDSPKDMIEEVQKIRESLKLYPEDMMLQLGLNMAQNRKGYCDRVLNGEYDEGLKVLGRSLDSLNKKVFIRIGYEANGHWNDYDPGNYRKAFRHVSKLLRAESDNIATVWHIHNIDSIKRIMEFYPGDGYVDWWAFSFFPLGFVNESLAHFLDSAETHQKPVMIGESTASESGLGAGAKSWYSWYYQYFKTIRDEPVIKAFCYINRDWRYSDRLAYWGSSWLKDDSVVLGLYQREISSPLYQHADTTHTHQIKTFISSSSAHVSSKFPEVNYSDSSAVFIKESRADTVMGFIKFDWGNIDFDEVVDARIFLMGKSDHEEYHNVSVFLAEDEWDSETLNWKNQPVLKDSIGAVRLKSRYKKRSLNITEIFKAYVEDGKKTMTIAFTQPTGKNITYYLNNEKAPFYPSTLKVAFKSSTRLSPESNFIVSRSKMQKLDYLWSLVQAQFF